MKFINQLKTISILFLLINFNTMAERPFLSAIGNLENFLDTMQLGENVDKSLAPPCPDCLDLGEVVPPDEPLCEQPALGKVWVQNCQQLFKKSDIPKDALRFTMKSLVKNLYEFKSNKCYKMPSSKHYSSAGQTKENFKKRMELGIPNKCQIMINDTRQKLPKGHDDNYELRRQSYYIDLCKKSGPSVTKLYFNLGEKTLSNDYKNAEGYKTTVLGAFLTNTDTFDLSFNGSKYRKLRVDMEEHMGKHYAPGLLLYGLQETNNNAALNVKYLHVSPYKSSHGCPSIYYKNYWMIEELATNGPSLVVNYGPEIKMDDIDLCSEDE
jgi:hypothetical protein